MDKNYHVDCYCCNDCSTQLTDEPGKRCYPLNNILLCYVCHMKRLGVIVDTSSSINDNLINSNSTNNNYNSNTYLANTFFNHNTNLNSHNPQFSTSASSSSSLNTSSGGLINQQQPKPSTHPFLYNRSNSNDYIDK